MALQTVNSHRSNTVPSQTLQSHFNPNQMPFQPQLNRLQNPLIQSPKIMSNVTQAVDHYGDDCNDIAGALVINLRTGLSNLLMEYENPETFTRPISSVFVQVLFSTLLCLMLPHFRILDETLYLMAKRTWRVTLHYSLDLPITATIFSHASLIWLLSYPMKPEGLY